MIIFSPQIFAVSVNGAPNPEKSDKQSKCLPILKSLCGNPVPKTEATAERTQASADANPLQREYWVRENFEGMLTNLFPKSVDVTAKVAAKKAAAAAKSK